MCETPQVRSGTVTVRPVAADGHKRKRHSTIKLTGRQKHSFWLSSEWSERQLSVLLYVHLETQWVSDCSSPEDSCQVSFT